jgi:broad specificity polyphosphatase/5'/3'-nucleotidase SurE
MKNGFRTASLVLALSLAAAVAPFQAEAMSIAEYSSQTDKAVRMKEFDKAFDSVVNDMVNSLKLPNDSHGNLKTPERKQRDEDKIAFLRFIRYHYDPAKMNDKMGAALDENPKAQLEDIITVYIGDAWKEHAEPIKTK